jgi:hypothetical protein
MAGGGTSSSNNFSAGLVNNYPLAIGGAVVQGAVGNGATSQQGNADATGGTFSANFSAGLGLQMLNSKITTNNNVTNNHTTNVDIKDTTNNERTDILGMHILGNKYSYDRNFNAQGGVQSFNMLQNLNSKITTNNNVTNNHTTNVDIKDTTNNERTDILGMHILGNKYSYDRNFNAQGGVQSFNVLII